MRKIFCFGKLGSASAESTLVELSYLLSTRTEIATFLLVGPIAMTGEST